MSKRVMTEEILSKAQKMRDNGLSYAKIGNALGVSSATVQSHLAVGAQEKRAIYGAAYQAQNKDKRAAYYRAHKEQHRRSCAAWEEEHKEERKATRDANKGEIKIRNAANYELNKEERVAYAAAYRAANPEKSRITLTNSYAAHKEERRAYRRAYYSEHKEEIAVASKVYREEHSAELVARASVRRALIAGVTIGNLAEIKAIYKRAKEDPKIRCYLCGDVIALGDRHVDHIFPLSKGGEHRPSNLAVACSDCNLKKKAKLPEEIGLLL